MNTLPPPVPNQKTSVAPASHLPATARILVPLDFDDRSRRLLREAAVYAHPLGAELVLLHVFDPVPYAPAHTTPALLADWQRSLHDEAERQLAAFRREFEDCAAVQSARLIVEAGFLEDVVFAVAARVHATIIMITTHGYTGIRHLFLGSKAERIARHAHCPVLILPDS